MYIENMETEKTQEVFSRTPATELLDASGHHLFLTLVLWLIPAFSDDISSNFYNLRSTISNFEFLDALASLKTMLDIE